jgi:hypothetical protein
MLMIGWSRRSNPTSKPSFTGLLNKERLRWFRRIYLTKTIIVVRLTPKTALPDIYASILRQAGIQMRTTETVAASSETTTSFGAKVKAMIAVFGGEASAKAEAKGCRLILSYRKISQNFNGDLLDRLIEVPVEPWGKQDFRRVVEKGSDKLFIEIDRTIIEKGIDCSFSSIGVFQELLKELCLGAGVRERGTDLIRIEGLNLLDEAIRRKAAEYAARHQRALEAIAAGNVSTSAKEGVQPLFLPYYLVRMILEAGYPGLIDGMRRATIQEDIKKMHHRGDDVRASDMSNLLYNLAALQSNKEISPPIIDYDRNTKMLQVVDSTFYFFLQNADLSEIASELPDPVQDVATTRAASNRPQSE